MNQHVSPREYQNAVGVAESGGIHVPSPDEYATNINLEAEASKLANANRPAAADDSTEITSDLQNLLGKRFDVHTTVTEKAIAEASTIIDESEVHVIDGELPMSHLRDQVFEKHDTSQDELVDLNAKAANDLRQLNAFKEDRKITRDASFAENPVTTMVLLCLCIMGESLANVFFMKDAMDGGIITALVLTALVSILNVAVLGFLFTGHLGSRLAEVKGKTLVRATGMALTAGGILGGFALNLFLAHYRDRAMLDDNLDFMQVVPVLLQPQNWFSLHDFNSFALMLVGFGLFVLAIWKGNTWDDPVWGYAKVTRTAQASAAGRDAKRKELKDGIHASVNDVKQRLQNRHDENEGLIRAQKQAFVLAERTVNDRKRAMLADEKACARLFTKVFEINKRIRGRDVVLPAWATQPPASTFPVKDFEPYLMALRVKVGLSEEMHKQNRAAIIAFTKALPETRDALTREFLARIAECERRAEPFTHGKV